MTSRLINAASLAGIAALTVASGLGQEMIKRNVARAPLRRLAPGPQQISMTSVPYSDHDVARIAKAKKRRDQKAARRISQKRGK